MGLGVRVISAVGQKTVGEFFTVVPTKSLYERKMFGHFCGRSYFFRLIFLQSENYSANSCVGMKVSRRNHTFSYLKNKACALSRVYSV
jgi:hypothetical protein